MQPIIPDRYVSHREKLARDAMMNGVRKAIWDKRLQCHQIRISDRPIVAAVRARILRGEYESFSLKRAFLLADATGVDNMTVVRCMCMQLVPETPLTEDELAKFEALMPESEAA